LGTKMQKKKNYPISERLNSFRSWMVSEGYAESSRKKYFSWIKDFLEHVSQFDDEDAVRNYITSLVEERGYSGKTVNCYMDAIKAFHKSKKLRIDLPRRHKRIEKLPVIYSDEILEDIIIPFAEDRKLFKNTDKAVAIFDFTFKTGLRRSEVIKIKRCQLDLENFQGYTYSSKGRRERVFYFDSKTRTRLKDYFLTEDEESNIFNLTAEGLYYYFARLRKKIKKQNMSYAEKFKQFSPHKMRMSIATSLYNNGATMEYIQGFLDHRDINTTKGYVKQSNEDRKKIYLRIMEGKGK